MSEAISHSDDDSPWLLASLCSGPDHRHWPLASYALGLLGVTTFAIAASAAAGVYLSWAARWQTTASEVLAVVSILASLPFLAGAYVSVLLAMHLMASCKMPVTLRLSMIYATVYLSLGSALGGFETPVTSLQILYASSLCFGSFLQQRFGRWHAVGWNQPPDHSSKITIGTLLDITAAIALTLWLVGDDSVSIAAYACFLPVAGLSAIIGMHVWARLTAICPDSSDRVSGSGLWMAGNLSLACLIWLVLAIALPHTAVGMFGIIAAILVVVVAHWWTEIPIRWLRACGWQLVRG